MSTTTSPRRFFMKYHAEDFPLFLLSLTLTGILIAPALPHRFEQVLLVGALVYLALMFPIRHGAKFESSVFRVALEGMARYPAILARNLRTASHAAIPTAAAFLLALTIEHFLRPSLAGTKWLSPFPWQWAVWTAFLLVTLFRVTILIAHLRRASVVREVLEKSPQRKTIAVLSIHQHIFHAFITGMLAHLSQVAPCVLFYMLTDPSNLRETLLIAGCALWSVIARPLRKRRIIKRPFNHLFYQNHTRDHQSRFLFTVFHGHHHDAIPSALIGSGGGTGFLENAALGLSMLDPLKSIVVAQVSWVRAIAIDMVIHQYIPGVFPFSKATVVFAAHHVSHHFGSARPLGIVFRDYVESGDMNDGYKPNNAVTRWFLSEVERRERLDPELGKKFLSLNDYGAVSKTPSTSTDARAGTDAARAEAASGSADGPQRGPIPPLLGN
jgi:hypothetical protein